MLPIRAVLIWVLVAAALAMPTLAAGLSPLLAWREPVYIAAGFAGIAALALLFMQPLLAAGALPGLAGTHGRRLHRWGGMLLIVAVVLHVAGLWITSPPDVLDALLFRSPTPFSAWGVVAMWAVFGAALLAAVRRKLKLSPRLWRRAHLGLALVCVAGTVAHALLIEGTMEPVTKVLLCLLALGASLVVAAGRIWARPSPRRRDRSRRIPH